MRHEQLIKNDISDIYRERADDSVRDLKAEVIYFHGLIKEEQAIVDSDISDPSARLREGVPLAELRKVSQNAKNARKDIEIYQALIATIVAEMTPTKAPYERALTHIATSIEALTVNKERYLKAATADDPTAVQFERAFYSNMSGLVRQLASDEIPVNLIKELQENIEYIPTYTLNGAA